MFRNKLIGILFLLAALLPASANAASCFWVGGTAAWDGSNFTSWATSSGGAGLGCPTASNVPTSADTVTFDGSSGGGTVTVNATISISSLTTSAFTGTIDFSANNNNINIGTVTPPTTAWIDGASAAHTINMGNGTWAIDSTVGIVNLGGANLTLTANSSTLSIVARANTARSWTGAKTFNNFTINGAASSQLTINSAITYSTLTIVGQQAIVLAATQTTATLVITSSAALPVSFRSNTIGTQRTIALTNSLAASFLSLQDIAFSGGTNTATNSFDFGNNTGITITGPSGSGGGKIIGGWLLRRDLQNDNDNLPMFLSCSA